MNYSNEIKAKVMATDWNKADENGIINVPDELDPLINKVGMQFNFVNISGKNQNQAICDIVKGCQDFFEKKQQDEEHKNLCDFFMWFRDNGEKYIGKSIEEFVSIYLNGQTLQQAGMAVYKTKTTE